MTVDTPETIADEIMFLLNDTNKYAFDDLGIVEGEANVIGFTRNGESFFMKVEQA